MDFDTGTKANTKVTAVFIKQYVWVGFPLKNIEKDASRQRDPHIYTSQKEGRN